MQSGDDLVQIEDLRAHDLPAGEREQLAGEVGSPSGGGLDVLDVTADAGPALVGVAAVVFADRVRDELGVAEDDRQQVVEVVRHPTGELAHALQTLVLLELVLEELPRRRGRELLFEQGALGLLQHQRRQRRHEHHGGGMLGC